MAQLWWAVQSACSSFKRSETFAKMQDSLERRKWHNRKSSESNLIAAMHQVLICILELDGKRLFSEER